MGRSSGASDKVPSVPKRCRGGEGNPRIRFLVKKTRGLSWKSKKPNKEWSDMDDMDDTVIKDSRSYQWAPAKLGQTGPNLGLSLTQSSALQRIKV